MNETEYKALLLRIKKGEEEIKKRGGSMHAPKLWVDEYQRLAEEQLMYEIENDLLPDYLL